MNWHFDWQKFLLPLLLAAACTPVPSQQNISPPANPWQQELTESSLSPVASAIRPTSKGQRLEFGELSGDLIVPAESAALLAAQVNGPLAWLTGSPAWAAGLSESELKQFKARVDSQAVTLKIEKIQLEANGDSRVSYHLSQVPVQSYTQLLEFYSPSESITLKGVLSEVKANSLNRLSDPIDLETTAALEVIAQDETLSLEQLTPEDVRSFSKKPELQDYLKFLKKEFQRSENKQRKFKEISAQFNLREQTLPRLKSGLKELKEAGIKRCQQDPVRCRQRLLACVPSLLRRCRPLEHPLQP